MNKERLFFEVKGCHECVLLVQKPGRTKSGRLSESLDLLQTYCPFDTRSERTDLAMRVVAGKISPEKASYPDFCPLPRFDLVVRAALSIEKPIDDISLLASRGMA